MKLFRNREYQKELLSGCLLTVLFAAGGFFVSLPAGFLLLGLGAALLVLHYIYCRRRYRRIAELSEEIDRILHQESVASISAEDEGELSILQNEIRKMVARLQEQTEALKSDKKRLSEAIEDIFHQLRTPLTSMNLSAEMLRNPELTPEKRMKIVRELKTSLERIHWQVETLLKISKIDAGTALFREDEVSVRELIDKASADLLIPMELRDQHFVTEISGERFQGDLLWSAEAIGNLLKNAVEHTPAGGEIRVSSEETPIYTEIILRDSGPGFESSEIPYLFDRFFKGKQSSEDSIGIGLALARMIITEENGTIVAGNAPDGGAEFVVRFYKSVV